MSGQGKNRLSQHSAGKESIGLLFLRDPVALGIHLVLNLLLQEILSCLLHCLTSSNLCKVTYQLTLLIVRNLTQGQIADQGLFEEHMSVVRSDFTSEQIVSHYFLNIAPYISPDMNPHALLSAEQVIDLFLNGIRK